MGRIGGVWGGIFSGGGCPFWKQKGGQYEYLGSAYVGTGDFCSFNIHRQ